MSCQLSFSRCRLAAIRHCALRATGSRRAESRSKHNRAGGAAGERPDRSVGIMRRGRSAPIYAGEVRSTAEWTAAVVAERTPMSGAEADDKDNAQPQTVAANARSLPAHPAVDQAARTRRSACLGDDVVRPATKYPVERDSTRKRQIRFRGDRSRAPRGSVMIDIQQSIRRQTPHVRSRSCTTAGFPERRRSDRIARLFQTR